MFQPCFLAFFFFRICFWVSRCNFSSRIHVEVITRKEGVPAVEATIPKVRGWPGKQLTCVCVCVCVRAQAADMGVCVCVCVQVAGMGVCVQAADMGVCKQLTWGCACARIHALGDTPRDAPCRPSDGSSKVFLFTAPTFIDKLRAWLSRVGQLCA